MSVIRPSVMAMRHLSTRFNRINALISNPVYTRQLRDCATNAVQSERDTDTSNASQDARFMQLALRQAETGGEAGEVPVGAVLVSATGQILATAHNAVESTHDPTAHAELLCIRQASSLNTTWRLNECTLYVTLEPCPMCAGALLQSRVGTVVYGARNTLLGAHGSWIHMLPSTATNDNDNKTPRHPFHPNMVVRRGVLEEECGAVMKQFFAKRRQQQL